METANLEKAQENLLKLLENSPKPLSKSVLLRTVGKLGLDALLALEKSKKIKNRGTEKKSAYVVLSEKRTLFLTEKAERLILGHQPGKIAPILVSKVKELISDVEIKDLVEKAARNLVKKKLGIMFQCGSGLYFLHLDPIRKLLDSADGASSGEKNQSPTETDRILRLKFKEVADKTRSPDISIAELIRASNLEPKIVKDWLYSQCTAHAVNPSKGEPTQASAEEESAALEIDGELFYLVRLLK